MFARCIKKEGAEKREEGDADEERRHIECVCVCSKESERKRGERESEKRYEQGSLPSLSRHRHHLAIQLVTRKPE